MPSRCYEAAPCSLPPTTPARSCTSATPSRARGCSTTRTREEGGQAVPGAEDPRLRLRALCAQPELSPENEHRGPSGDLIMKTEQGCSPTRTSARRRSRRSRRMLSPEGAASGARPRKQGRRHADGREPARGHDQSGSPPEAHRGPRPLRPQPAVHGETRRADGSRPHQQNGSGADVGEELRHDIAQRNQTQARRPRFELALVAISPKSGRVPSPQGRALRPDPTTAVVEAGGVGFDLRIPISTYERLKGKKLASSRTSTCGKTSFVCSASRRPGSEISSGCCSPSRASVHPLPSRP